MMEISSNVHLEESVKAVSNVYLGKTSGMSRWIGFGIAAYLVFEVDEA